MSKELVISANRHEIKVAILEDDQLVEVFFQRANEYSLAGSIHKGRVTRVLPGMQSAFVDLGLERDTFLYVSDFFGRDDEDFDRVSVTREPGRGERPVVEAGTVRRVERSDAPPSESAAAPKCARLRKRRASRRAEPLSLPRRRRKPNVRIAASVPIGGDGAGVPAAAVAGAVDSRIPSTPPPTLPRPPRFGEAAPAAEPAAPLPRSAAGV